MLGEGLTFSHLVLFPLEIPRIDGVTETKWQMSKAFAFAMSEYVHVATLKVWDHNHHLRNGLIAQHMVASQQCCGQAQKILHGWRCRSDQAVYIWMIFTLIGDGFPMQTWPLPALASRWCCGSQANDFMAPACVRLINKKQNKGFSLKHWERWIFLSDVPITKVSHPNLPV